MQPCSPLVTNQDCEFEQIRSPSSSVTTTFRVIRWFCLLTPEKLALAVKVTFLGAPLSAPHGASDVMVPCGSVRVPAWTSFARDSAYVRGTLQSIWGSAVITYGVSGPRSV